jgi:uncharacterized protein
VRDTYSRLQGRPAGGPRHGRTGSRASGRYNQRDLSAVARTLQRSTGLYLPAHHMLFRYAVVVAFLLAAACRGTPPEPPVPCLSIATGAIDDVSYVFGAALARVFSEREIGVCLSAESTDGSSFNVKALDDAAADFALARADTVYTAYVEGTPLRDRPHPALRGVAIVYASVLQIVVRADSPVMSWVDLRNTLVGYWIFSNTDLTPIVGYRRLAGAAEELGPGEIQGVRLRSVELSHALVSDQISAGFVLTAYPVPFLSQLARDMDIRFLEIEPAAAARIRARYPFFKPATIPAGTYRDQQQVVRTIAVENLLVTRRDVGEDVVYEVTRTLLEGLPRLEQDHPAALQVNPDLAPATPIPLHPGAARYYRERELLQ